jgi:hypothetical protein
VVIFIIVITIVIVVIGIVFVTVGATSMNWKMDRAGIVRGSDAPLAGTCPASGQRGNMNKFEV